MTRDEADELLQQWWYEIRGSLASQNLRKRIVDAMVTDGREIRERCPTCQRKLCYGGTGVAPDECYRPWQGRADKGCVPTQHTREGSKL